MRDFLYMKSISFDLGADGDIADIQLDAHRTEELIPIDTIVAVSEVDILEDGSAAPPGLSTIETSEYTYLVQATVSDIIQVLPSVRGLHTTEK